METLAGHLVEIITLGLPLALLVILGITRGSNLLLAIALSTMISGYVLTIFPYKADLLALLAQTSSINASLPKIIILFIFMIPISFIARSVLSSTSGKKDFKNVLIASVAIILLFLSVAVNAADLSQSQILSDMVLSIFSVHGPYVFWIAILSLLSLILV